MERIMVIGVSAGVGKSTFSQALGTILQLPVRHLDAFYWKSGWIQAAEAEFKSSHQRLIGERKWIIDGNYTSLLSERMQRADTIIYLELPLRTCLFRVIKRRLAYRGKTREDMAEGCPEKVDMAFIRFIVTTYKGRKAAMKNHLDEAASTKKVIILKNREEAEKFLQSVRNRQE